MNLGEMGEGDMDQICLAEYRLLAAGSCQQGNEPSGSTGILRLTASQEGLSYMEFLNLAYTFDPKVMWPDIRIW